MSCCIPENQHHSLIHFVLFTEQMAIVFQIEPKFSNKETDFPKLQIQKEEQLPPLLQYKKVFKKEQIVTLHTFLKIVTTWTLFVPNKFLVSFESTRYDERTPLTYACTFYVSCYTRQRLWSHVSTSLKVNMHTDMLILSKWGTLVTNRVQGTWNLVDQNSDN